jgi:TonB family protein
MTSRSGTFSDAAGSAIPAVHRGPIRNTAFGDVTVEKGAAPSAKAVSFGTLTPVEILLKPRPDYTAEARAKKLEGEVLLEMLFAASGEARVLRVIRGLGSGLDESAIAAARGIRFRPAAHDGVAVDCSAVVHILFQLAN